MNLKNQKLIIVKTLKWKSKPLNKALLLCLFLFLGANPIFSQVEVEVQENDLLENGISTGGDDSVLPLNYGIYPNWKGFHSQLVIDEDPNGNVTSGTLLSSVSKVAFQYGIEGLQEVVTGQLTQTVPFAKRYSIRYYGQPDNGQLKYFRKFYYNKGHINLEVGDEIHVLYHEVSRKYMLYHVRGEDKTLLECETYTILETPELHSYISKYGRPTDTPSGNPATVTYDTEDLLSYAWYAWANQEVAWQTIIGNLMDASIACQSSPCADYYTTLSVPRGCAIRPVDCGVPEGRVSVASEIGDVSVYPNPTSGMTTVELNGLTDETIKIRIIDLTGKLVKEQAWSVTTGSNLTQVDMTSAPAGVYHVEFDSEYKFKSQKIIIIK